MEDLQIHISVNSELFLKNPESTELGRRIIREGMDLILSLGFEAFTFKKLSEKIGTSEGSIYRYFENKHMFLVYLTCWYWSWIEYMLVMVTMNVESNDQKLKNAIRLLTEPIKNDGAFLYIDKQSLEQIIITESFKTYHTKNVDTENEKGYFTIYKRVVKRVSDIILKINPGFCYPHTLISTIIEGAHHQRYFALHLPSLTDLNGDSGDMASFYAHLVFKVIEA